MELHDVSYGIEYVARPLLLFFSSENQLLWFRYREYDLAHLKLVLEFSIYNVWKSVQYGVSNGLDTAYWGFLGARRRIFLMDTAYWSSEYGNRGSWRWRDGSGDGVDGGVVMMVTRWRWWFGDGEGRSRGEAKVGSAVAVVVTMMVHGGGCCRSRWSAMVRRGWWPEISRKLAGAAVAARKVREKWVARF
ncbi:hypothetical protein Tco_1402609 [Tanacetum coccineum]